MAALAAVGPPPGAPRTALDFERAAKALSGDPRAWGAYVEEHLTPGSLSGLFKQSLSPRCIEAVAVAVGRSLVPGGKAALGMALMEELRGVPRFGVSVMALPRGEGGAVAEAVAALGRAGLDVSRLREAYHL